jgi:prepilin peptidase CpaA
MLGHPSLSGAGQILLGILVAVAAAYDFRFRRIPNWLVLAGIVAGFTWNVFSLGWTGLGVAGAGLGTGFILYFPLYLLRARGAGDVKLLAAAGSIAGAANCLWIFFLTAILGGVIAVVLLLFKGRLQKTYFNVAWIMRDLLRFRAPYLSSEELDVTTSKGMRLPHGVLIAVGVTAFVFVAKSGLRF